MRGSFQEPVPRKTAENTVKYRNGGVGSVVANQRDGSESSVVVTTLVLYMWGKLTSWWSYTELAVNAVQSNSQQ